MRNSTNYENPKMEVLIFEDVEIIRTSLTNGVEGPGNSGDLPTETSEGDLPL